MHSKRIQKKVKQDYDSIAEDFSNTRHFPWSDFDLFKPYYESHFEVLDLGCGNGRLLIFLQKEGYKNYTGLDQSQGLLEHAQKEYPKQKFVLGDMSDPLPFKEKFDALFVIASFHHLPPKDQVQVLKNWREHLKPGGFLFMTNWNLHQVAYLPLLLRSFIFPTHGLRGVLVPWQKKLKRYYFAFTKRRLARLFRQAGYSLLENRYTRDGESANLFTGKNILTIAQNGSMGRSH